MPLDTDGHSGGMGFQPPRLVFLAVDRGSRLGERRHPLCQLFAVDQQVLEHGADV
jgi:hypothetical protein